MTVRPIPLAVELKGLAKRFGSVQANRDIFVKVPKGSVHGIIGENGAGKSTAMNMLYGLYAPDSGEICINGTPQHFNTPSDAIAQGIGMVHQHFLLSLEENAVDNIILGIEPLKFKTLRGLPRAFFAIDRKRARQKLESLAKTYGLEVPWDVPVGELNVGQQQRIEILKLLYRDADILILDEPTAVLTPQETEQIFEQIRKLKSLGKSIILITHKLKEVLSLCDNITVFRAGSVVGERVASHTNENELAELMVGRHLELHQKSDVRPTSAAPALLKVSSLSLRSGGVQKLEDVSFEIQPGEILGIAGVQGNGQSELHHVLLNPVAFFKEQAASGEIFLEGNSINLENTRSLFQKGLASIAEDRLKEAVIKDFSVFDNFLMGLHRFTKFSNVLTFHKNAVSQSLKDAVTNFGIKVPDVALPLHNLSGGNQQKVVVARELEKHPKVLLASQPTRGVDIGAIEFIHHEIRELQKKGAAILLISSELSEILALSQKIVVFYKGKIVARFDARQCTEQALGLAMGGAAPAPEAGQP